MPISETRVTGGVSLENASTSSSDRMESSSKAYLNAPTGEGIQSYVSLEPRRPKVHSKSTASLLASRALFTQCLEELERIVEVPNDFVLQENALSRIHVALDTAWNRRGDYEDAFAEIVNMFQIAFYDRTLADFSPGQSEALRSAFAVLGNADSFDDQLGDDVTTELLRGGIDVFRELE